MAARDMNIETQLSMLFREEAALARLPRGAWQAVASRMGEPEAPGILWRLRNMFSLPQWPAPSVAKYAAPAGVVALIAAAVTLFVMFSNPNTDGPSIPGQSATATALAQVSPTMIGATGTIPAAATMTAQPQPTGTVLPTPTPTPAALPTSAPGPLTINRVNFGAPVVGTVFEALLARMPDNEITRQLTELSDIAGPNALYGLELPPPGTDFEVSEVAMTYIQRFNDLYWQGYPVLLPDWPDGFRPYIETVHPFESLGFDFLSVAQNAYAARRFSIEGLPFHSYDIAFGQFGPQATANTLAACGCDQPEVRSYGGTAFYAWGEEFEQNLSKRLAPPLYDNLGRGPRLLVGDGEAYYSLADAAMEEMIDVANGAMPSLAEDADYMLALRWLASLGDMATMEFSSTYTSLEEIEDLTRYLETINSAPLLKRFELAASGIGHDGERLFTGIVIVNPDEATAIENAALLEQRIRESQPGFGPRPWSEMVDVVEIGVEGRVTLARLYLPVRPGSRVDVPLRLLVESLVVSE